MTQTHVFRRDKSSVLAKHNFVTRVGKRCCPEAEAGAITCQREPFSHVKRGGQSELAWMECLRHRLTEMSVGRQQGPFATKTSRPRHKFQDQSVSHPHRCDLYIPNARYLSIILPRPPPNPNLPQQHPNTYHIPRHQPCGNTTPASLSL